MSKSDMPDRVARATTAAKMSTASTGRPNPDVGVAQPETAKPEGASDTAAETEGKLGQGLDAHERAHLGSGTAQ